MEKASQLIFRQLTPTDFYNLYKPVDSEIGGGGQTYIDIPTSAVTSEDWDGFLPKASKHPDNASWWSTSIRSIGIDREQLVDIRQRRPASISIRNQTLDRQGSNRIMAWLHENTGFPQPLDRTIRETIPGLTIFFLKSTKGEIWAGWFLSSDVKAAAVIHPSLQRLLDEKGGIIHFPSPLPFDPSAKSWPFGLSAESSIQTEEPPPIESTLALLKNYESNGTLGSSFLEDLKGFGELSPQKRLLTISAYRRDARIVSALKNLYGGQCQLTGTKFTFKKVNGEYYSEAHHLKPLGIGGLDSPFNLIIVSPLIHRMFHFAKIENLDLASIRDSKLRIRINGDPHTITWHPKHSQFIQELHKAVRSR